MSTARPSPAVPGARRRQKARDVSHNLNGQRLGRKGRDTRARILAAAQELIQEPDGMQLSLSAVARRSSLGMTSLYLYFTDLTELLLALLEPVMATVEDSYLRLLRNRWPDDEIEARAREFVGAYYEFWRNHSRLLHLRNNMADRHDARMLLHRIQAAQPTIRLMVTQMDADPDERSSAAVAMGTVLMTGLERTVTIATDDVMKDVLRMRISPPEQLIPMEARLLALGIRDCRTGSETRDPTA